MKEPGAKNILSKELLYKMDAYWRASNYLSVGQIYLWDNPLLREPLKLFSCKTKLIGSLGHVTRTKFYLCPS
ncbi:MAG: hypothetical protein U5N26_12385 [Candidatus Marinimicrobia bacterium]|nr:hypothetical protein [Candidatus Neomarinimicrobiota bacterium]